MSKGRTSEVLLEVAERLGFAPRPILKTQVEHILFGRSPVDRPTNWKELVDEELQASLDYLKKRHLSSDLLQTVQTPPNWNGLLFDSEWPVNPPLRHLARTYFRAWRSHGGRDSKVRFFFPENSLFERELRESERSEVRTLAARFATLYSDLRISNRQLANTWRFATDCLFETGEAHIGSPSNPTTLVLTIPPGIWTNETGVDEVEDFLQQLQANQTDGHYQVYSPAHVHSSPGVAHA